MKKGKINVLWISDLVVPTGFSRVAHGIIANLQREKYNLIGIGVNYRGDPHGMSFPIYPATSHSNPRDLYGLSRIPEILAAHSIDVIFILNDAWVIAEYLKVIKQAFPAESTLPRIVVYFPVDAKDHSSVWYDDFDIVTSANVYTKFGKDVAELAYPKGEFNIIPHGVDIGTFHRLFENRAQAKEVLYTNTNKQEIIGDDSFIILNANRNQPRKRLELTMKGFKLFIEGKPDNISLFMHCGDTDAGHVYVTRLAANLRINNRLIISGSVKGIQQVSDNKLNLIYNATDVGINTSLGEGWGLPAMEHAITGAPQIVPDHSACAELHGECGLLIPTYTDLMLDGGAMTTGRLVSPEAVAEAMEKIYTDKELYKELSKKSVAKFSAPEYAWENIAATWDRVFQSLF